MREKNCSVNSKLNEMVHFCGENSKSANYQSVLSSQELRGLKGADTQMALRLGAHRTVSGKLCCSEIFTKLPWLFTLQADTEQEYRPMSTSWRDERRRAICSISAETNTSKTLIFKEIPRVLAHSERDIFNNCSTDTCLDLIFDILPDKTSQFLAYFVMNVTPFCKCPKSLNTLEI